MEAPSSHGVKMVECWDNDDDLQYDDGIQFRAASSVGSITNSSYRPSGHRDSISSRLSARSDLESNAGDEDWQVSLHDNDELAKEEALASAKTAGIPLPANIPKSALIGGEIKRLSARKPKRTNVDDWSDDVELPGPDVMLKLKTPKESTFPESIRQVSSTVTSPVKSTISPTWNEDVLTHHQPTSKTSNPCHDENCDFSYLNGPAIQSSVSRCLQTTTFHTPGSGMPIQREVDDFDQDLELPPDHQPLQLNIRKDAIRGSSPIMDDFDLEWSEGSIGVRVGGTARDGRSVPSSSISIASPSASSCLTGESEDDPLDGLIFPEEPFDFNRSLQKRQEANATAVSNYREMNQDIPYISDADDFFSGIEVDNGSIFAPGKLTLNPNVKCVTEWPTSPARRSATTLKFTNSTNSPRTRIPRLSGGHERAHSSHLETVSESGAPLSKFQRAHSRLGHSPHFSISSLSGPAALSPFPTQMTSGRRLLETRVAKHLTSVQESSAPTRHLRTKRSLPTIRGAPSATPVQTQGSPPCQDGRIGPSYRRPKTPVERGTSGVRPTTREISASFLPAGAFERQSQHGSLKTHRFSRRTNSDSPGNPLDQQGISRLSRSTRADTLRLSFGDQAAENPSKPVKRVITRPTRRRNFGDGTELESYDDLPTSTSVESKFVKTPVGRGAPRSVRSRFSQSSIIPPGDSPMPPKPSPTPKHLNQTPRFARDTNASRNAREQRMASMNSRNRDTNSLGSSNSSWKAHPISRTSPNAAQNRSRKPKAVTKAPYKPHLIKPMGSGVQDAKRVRGMQYNPETFRWEGNENIVQDFDSALVPKSPRLAPALIANVGTMQNVQTVGGMVFDPHRMCWLRARSLESGHQGGIPPEEEVDVFAGLDDLEDRSVGTAVQTLGTLDNAYPPGDDPSAGESSDDGPITEEFDVGPEFIRRQRAEEDKWRRKVDKWVGFDRGSRETSWRWAIRDLVADGMGNPAA